METSDSQPKARGPFAWIMKNVMDPDTRHISVNILYSAFAMVMLLNHVYVTLYFPKYYSAFFITPVPWCVFGFVSVILGRMWKDKGFFLLLILTFLTVIRFAVATGELLNGIVYTSIYAFGGCYAVGRALNERNRKRFLITFCALWTLAMVVYSCLSIYVAWTGETIKNLANGSIRIDPYNRLYPIYHPVQAGILASVSIAASFVGMFTVRKKTYRALFFAGAVIIFVFGILTASRVNHILNAFMLSGMICVLMHQHMKTSLNIAKGIGLVAVWAAVFVTFIWLQGFGIRAFNSLHTGKGGLITRAMADEVKTLRTRDIQLNNGLDGFLNGRIDTWKTLFQTLGKNPKLLLWGQSADKPMELVNAFRIENGLPTRAHAHNTWFQLLLENGIPGFLLYAGFTVYILLNGVRLVLNRKCEIWRRLLPFPVFLCFIADLVDITCYADTGHPQVTILFLFAGFVIAESRKTGKRKAEKVIKRTT